MAELKSIHSSNLERKGKYIVETPNGTYKGQYFTQPKYDFPYIVLAFVTCIKNGTMYTVSEALFDKQDKFYDAEEYINKIKEQAMEAKEQIETRAVDKILKGVVNEHFRWV